MNYAHTLRNDYFNCAADDCNIYYVESDRQPQKTTNEQLKVFLLISFCI